MSSTAVNRLVSHANREPEMAAYEVTTSSLGSGASGVVLLGRVRATGEGVAVKIIDKTRRIRDRATALEALQRESSILAKLKHPHIVGIHAYVDTETAAYFVIELMRGGELFDKIVELGSYTERDAASCVRNITDALAYLHSHGVVHRGAARCVACAFSIALTARRRQI